MTESEENRLLLSYLATYAQVAAAKKPVNPRLAKAGALLKEIVKRMGEQA